MVIDISREKLLAAARMVGKITPTKKGKPAMGWFLMEATRGGALRVTGTDMNGTMSAIVECISVEGDVSACVDAKQLTRIVAEVPDQPLTLRFGERSVTLEYFGGNFEIPVYPAAEFPRRVVEEKVVRLPVKVETVLEGINQVLECAGNDELRPVMSGVLVELKGATLTFVASNGHLLSFKETAYLGGDEVSAIIPRSAARLLVEMLSREENGAEVELELGNKRVAVETGDYNLSYRLAEGIYPNYRSVIPENDKEVEVDVAWLSAAIKRVSILSGTKDRYPLLKMNFDGDTLTMTSGSPDNGTSSREEAVLRTGWELEIGFNPDHVRLLLGLMTTEKCVLSFSAPSRPMIITPSGVKGVVSILMPMLLD